MLKFSVLASGLILFCATNVFAECRVVEYEDHNEVVCEKEAPTLSPTAPIQQPDNDSTSLLNNVKKNMQTIATITDEHPLLIERKVTLELVAAKLSTAEALLSKIEQTCERIGNPELLKAQGKYVAASEAESCREYRYLALPWLATMTVKTANYYASNWNKAVAKQMYRDVIIRFTGSKYKSQVKEAEFGLEDLK
jgi:hypothetical protein